MLNIFKKLIYLLEPRERKKMFLLVFMMLTMALLDMIGVASIFPFMVVLTDASHVETNIYLNKLFEICKNFGVENIQQFLFILGGGVLILLIISLTFKAFTIYAQVRFVNMCQYIISKRLIGGYLNQPYSWFLNRSSSNLGKIILSEVGIVIGGGLSPFMNLIARAMTTLALIFLLIVVDPKLTFIIAFVLSSAYGVIFFFTRKYLNRNGVERLENEELKFKAMNEAFGATKMVKVGGLEQTYTDKFSIPSKIIARNSALASSIALLPRFFLEAIAFGGIIVLILFLMGQSSFNAVLPIISLYAFAGYRLMPALQEIYSSFSKFITIGPSVNEMYIDLKNLKPISPNLNQEVLTLNKEITLRNIYYNYPKTTRTALKNINLTIPSKTTVGFIGKTGSGKTTTMDIILGLLESQKGTLKVDGKIISKENVKSWQSIIGYVPQHIYLTDDTIMANIAFGQHPKDISLAAVEKVSKIANLHNFIVNELPQKYNTSVGERGIRLSGGQIQRIGIARALYQNPKVLIFDEATSALDNETDKVVMEAVNKLGKDKTIIIVAHRLNTVKNCDVIFKLERGEIVAQGKFNELIDTREVY